ncbi:MAG TPA: 3-methyl-2-oxobutanoate hydroxymethyltransferase [Fimbriimonadaceae bacterium]|jgi:3-methyl-2-oxobutanoate hydroxymethyltransferase
MPSNPKKMTAPKLRAMKGGAAKIVCITAYDAVMGALADEAGVDLVLVGDSMGNVILGMESTIPVTLEQMVHHVTATKAGVKNALLVADLPFGTYQSGISQAVNSAVALVKAGAEAVKLEGTYTDEIRAIIKAGIPVMGHVGMTPQSLNNFGGFRVQGKGDHGSEVMEAAKEVVEAGAFSMVLELIPAALSKEITCEVDCPTIGIGAGVDCDGQVQIFHDMLGLSPFKLKHAKVYCEAGELMKKAIQEYAGEVRKAGFPTSEHSV